MESDSCGLKPLQRTQPQSMLARATQAGTIDPQNLEG